MISQGCSRILKERLHDQSDPYCIPVCEKCGQITQYRNGCKTCNEDSVSIVNIPYATKLLIHELMAMGMKMEIKTS
jgi:DNA-directed RNA polymerase II subunit RPB2